MPTPVVAACLWVIAAAAVALLPMRAQVLPGGLLLLSAPVIALWIGATQGWLWTLAALAITVSVFRRPLLHLFGRIARRSG